MIDTSKNIGAVLAAIRDVFVPLINSAKSSADSAKSSADAAKTAALAAKEAAEAGGGGTGGGGITPAQYNALAKNVDVQSILTLLGSVGSWASLGNLAQAIKSDTASVQSNMISVVHINSLKSALQGTDTTANATSIKSQLGTFTSGQSVASMLAAIQSTLTINAGEVTAELNSLTTNEEG